MVVRQYLSKRQRKELMRKLFEELLRSNRYLIVVDAKGLTQKLLTEVRRKANDYGFIIKGGKNGVLLKAIENVYPSMLSTLKELISGQNVFIFTNNNPIEIAMKLSELEVSLPISPGEVAPEDIVVPEGNTGIPPGPIISIFSSLSVPTRIISGTIHIMKETVVVKAGEKVSMEAASILQKLGIYPIKSRLKFKFAIDFTDTTIIQAEDLTPNIEELRSRVEELARRAFYLALGIGYPHPAVIPHLLAKASMNVFKLSLEIAYVTDRNIKALLLIAVTNAKKLESCIQEQGS